MWGTVPCALTWISLNRQIMFGERLSFYRWRYGRSGKWTHYLRSHTNKWDIARTQILPAQSTQTEPPLYQQPWKPVTLHPTSSVSSMNWILTWLLSPQRLGLLRSLAQTHPARKCQRNHALQLCPFPSLTPRERGFANDVHVHLLTPLILNQDIVFCQPALTLRLRRRQPFSLLANYPSLKVPVSSENVAGERHTSPRVQTVVDCCHDAVCSPTLDGFSFPAGRRDLILQMH